MYTCTHDTHCHVRINTATPTCSKEPISSCVPVAMLCTVLIIREGEVKRNNPGNCPSIMRGTIASPTSRLAGRAQKRNENLDIVIVAVDMQ